MLNIVLKGELDYSNSYKTALGIYLNSVFVII